MRLRGHHLFCSALYGGAGYSQAFCRRMEELLARAKAGEYMELVNGPDDLCAACPHRMLDGGCALGTENVGDRDWNALAVLGLSPGRRVTWAETRPLLAGVTEETFARVCRDCRWAKEGLCSAQLLREKLQA